jgi:HEAT repeat protein
MRHLPALLIVAAVSACFCVSARCQEGTGNTTDMDKAPSLADIPEYVKIIAEGDRLDAIRCGFKIHRLGEPAVKEVVKFLDDPDKVMRLGAVRALCDGGMKTWMKPFLPKLAERLKDEDWYVKCYCLDTLGTLEAKKCVPDIKLLLDDTDATIKAKARLALAKIGEAEYFPDAIALLKDSDPNISEDAAGVLIERRVKEAIPALLEMLKTEFEKRKKPEAPKNRGIQDVYDMMHSVFIYGDLVRAMGDLDVKDAIPVLKEIVKSGEPGSEPTAVFSLARLGDKEVAADLTVMLKSDVKWHRATAAEFLGKLGAKEAAKDLAALLADTEADVRLKSLLALMALDAKEMAPDVAKLLKDSVPIIRMNAVHALGIWNARDAVAEVTELIKDANQGVRMNAVLSLGRLDARDRASDVEACLQDGNGIVRGVAAIVLVEWGAKARVPAKHAEDVNAVLKANWGEAYNNRATAALKELGGGPEAPGEGQK